MPLAAMIFSPLAGLQIDPWMSQVAVYDLLGLEPGRIFETTQTNGR
jgi:hypothetical protein